MAMFYETYVNLPGVKDPEGISHQIQKALEEAGQKQSLTAIRVKRGSPWIQCSPGSMNASEIETAAYHEFVCDGAMLAKLLSKEFETEALVLATVTSVWASTYAHFRNGIETRYLDFAEGVWTTVRGGSSPWESQVFDYPANIPLSDGYSGGSLDIAKIGKFLSLPGFSIHDWELECEF